MGSIQEPEIFASDLLDFESELGLGSVLTLNQLCDLWVALSCHHVSPVR